MRKHLVVLLTLSILLPLGTTFLMGWQALDRDRENSLRRVRETLSSRVEENTRRLAQTLEQITQEVQSLEALLTLENPLIQDPLIRQVYFAEKFRVNYPPQTGGTKDEGENHQRFQRLLDQGLFSPSLPEGSDRHPGEQAGWATTREDWDSYYY